VKRDPSGYRVVAPLTVDTQAAPSDYLRLKRHWARVALHRLEDPRPEDLFSYNVMSVSSRDLKRIRELLRATFREIRSIVAASEPIERGALVNLQLMEW